MMMINDEIKTSMEIDAGYMAGKSLFETILIIRGQGLFLEEHIARLNRGLEFFSIQKRISKEDVLEKIAYFNELVKKDRFVLKLNVSEKNIVYSTRDYTYSSEDYREACMGISSARRGKSEICKYKTANCLENTIELVKGREKGNIDMLFLNMKEEILEGCVSNVFILAGGKIITPPLELGILDGVVRGWVMENFPVVEQVMGKEILEEADGMFITNSLMGIMPIHRIEDRILDSMNKREIREIFQAYGRVLALLV